MVRRHIVIYDEARDDLREIQDWYALKEQGLDLQFVAEFERAMQSIRDFPEMANWISENARKKALRRFPYQIYFIFDDDRIAVVGVLHCHRSASAWKKRFR